jgi:hypothetical protein
MYPESIPPPVARSYVAHAAVDGSARNGVPNVNEECGPIMRLSTGRHRVGRSGASAGVSGGMFVAVVAILVAFVPAAGANILHSALIAPPYGGTAFQASNWYNIGCGFGTATPKLPSFSTSSGVFTGSVKSNATSCGTVGTHGSTEIEGGLDPSSTFSVTSAKHHFVVHTTFTFDIHLRATTGGATPYADAYTEMYIYAEIYDLTNGSYAYPSYSQHQYNSTSSGTVTYHATKHLIDDLNVTTVSTHTYELFAFLIGYTYAAVNPGSNFASAMLNLATGGDQGKLVSVTYT